LKHNFPSNCGEKDFSVNAQIKHATLTLLISTQLHSCHFLGRSVVRITTNNPFLKKRWLTDFQLFISSYIGDVCVDVWKYICCLAGRTLSLHPNLLIGQTFYGPIWSFMVYDRHVFRPCM